MVPISDTRWKVFLSNISCGVHTGKKSEILVSDNWFCISAKYEIASHVKNHHIEVLIRSHLVRNAKYLEAKIAIAGQIKVFFEVTKNTFII